MIVLTIHNPRPGQVDTVTVFVDGNTTLAATLAEAARTTPDEILTVPGARAHRVAEERGVLTVRAGRILEVRTEPRDL